MLGSCRSAVNGAAASLTSGARVLQRACQGQRLTAEDQAAAAQAVQLRCVALGWLHAISSRTSQQQHHKEERAGEAYEAYSQLLEQVLQKHPQLHERVGSS